MRILKGDDIENFQAFEKQTEAPGDNLPSVGDERGISVPSWCTDNIIVLSQSPGFRAMPPQTSTVPGPLEHTAGRFAKRLEQIAV